ncbi:MAG: RnfABCDGE type electron transport complex subunit B [Clostridia bacterium]
MTAFLLVKEINFAFLYLLKDINWTTVLWAAGIMGGGAILLSILMVITAKVFEVKRDRRLEEIEALLPGANCGGCGYPGCAGLAAAIVEGKASVDDCSGNTPSAKFEIATIMGLSYGGGDETVAVVACSGGNSCQDKYVYQGYGDCKSQNIMAGGKKECPVGCMGTGSCVDACPNFAIEVKEGVAKVDLAQCTSCGACIAACPKKLIKRVPKNAKVYVACSSNCKGKDVTLVCKSGCISCGMCIKNCPQNAIEFHNNVPVIDYRKCNGCLTCVEKCPRKVIKLMR